MLTQCPNCQTIYQITASELSAAKGFVACGECETQFNALDRIADEPNFGGLADPTTAQLSTQHKQAPAITLIDSPPTDDTVAPVVSVEARDNTDDAYPRITPDQTPTAEPTNDLASDDRLISDQSDDVTSSDQFDQTLELDEISVGDVSGASEQINYSPTTLPPEEHAILFTDGEQEAQFSEIDQQQQVETNSEASRETVAAKIMHPTNDLDLDEVPAILQEELMAMAQPKKPRTPWYWGVVALILLLAATAQTAWYVRDQLMTRFPSVTPYLELLCERIGCELTTATAAHPIQLVSRDVRSHPRYENSLLVNASMVNSGDKTIDFPTIQLGLFDSTGTAIGIRQFGPAEYLDKSIDLVAGLPAGRSVHVVMELANVGEQATSFEFSFH